MRVRWELLPLVVMVTGCAGAAVEGPTLAGANGAVEGAPGKGGKGAAAAAPVRETSRGERPWAAEDLRIPPGKLRFTGELFVELPFSTRGGTPQRIAPDQLAFLVFEPGAYSGVRVLATRERLVRIEEPKGLLRFCVAKDGKVTFAVDEKNKLHHATSFEAPMRLLGTVAGDNNGSYFTNDFDVRRFVDCRRGAIEDMSKFRGYPGIQHSSDAATLVSFTAEDGRRTCRLRGGSEPTWEEMTRCSYAALQGDGLVRVFVETPDGSSTKCYAAFDPEGKRRPCGANPWAPFHAPPQESAIDFRKARFASPSLLVIPGVKGLSVMSTTGARADLKQVAPGDCEPLLAVSPIYRCISEDRRTRRVVAVDPDGKVKDELKISVPPGVAEPRFFEAGAGAMAMAGDCDGSPGEMLCVRQPDGKWVSSPFPADLVKVLHREAPAVAILPTVTGGFSAAVGVMDEASANGSIELSLYDSAKGLLGRAGRVPQWIAGDVRGGTSFLGIASYGSAGTDWFWRRAGTFTAWPLGRLHPAFRTQENCRFDVSLDGSTDVSCVSGILRAVGRFGMLEKKRGELLETFDGGETWFQVPLPEGVDTSDVDCAAIGCRVGPYFRLGWGI